MTVLFVQDITSGVIAVDPGMIEGTLSIVPVHRLGCGTAGTGIGVGPFDHGNSGGSTVENFDESTRRVVTEGVDIGGQRVIVRVAGFRHPIQRVIIVGPFLKGLPRSLAHFDHSTLTVKTGDFVISPARIVADPGSGARPPAFPAVNRTPSVVIVDVGEHFPGGVETLQNLVADRTVVVVAYLRSAVSFRAE